MKRIRDRVVGLDVHRDTIVACCRVAGPSDEVGLIKQSFSTTQGGLTELATFLGGASIETVAMEATGGLLEKRLPRT
jgi:transposase